MASDSSSQINIAVGGGEGLLSFKEDFGLDITKHIKSIKERFEYMMLQMYVESFTDQVMLHCKYNLFQSALVPGVEVNTDPLTRKMVLSLYDQDKLTVTFGIEQKGNQEIIF